MAEREIRLWGDPVLRSPCAPVTTFDASTAALAEDLADTARPAGRAAVAAPQIGVGLRAFGYDLDDRTGVVFNPEIVEVGGRLRDIDEGCLSVPGLFFPTPRWEFARVRGVDATGAAVEVSGTEVFAQMLQHEVAHLDGQVYIQTLPTERRREAMKAIRAAAWFAGQTATKG
ncbi:peptide deformylase [Brevibacterium sanguinis]|uniref:Peptide deformylase n=2 Tax=Brevibacterium TaxID=1696 RepID=A0A366IID8_9MICO|nr:MULTISPECIES: peptide deformylase [Brevibacterium]RBP64734.1 peptide deformylase [Brevibacterium sanguinis]RBP71623.1 peptide deformylase [Brevibacterium celere]